MDKIVQNARDALKEYRERCNVFWNNCETFVTSIVTGEGFSLQAQSVVKGVAIATGAAALVGGAAYYMARSSKKNKENMN